MFTLASFKLQDAKAAKGGLRQAKLPFKGSKSGGVPGTSNLMAPLVELVSRFTQATNELQLLGVVKPAAKRKAGAHARRLMWPAPISVDTRVIGRPID